MYYEYEVEFLNEIDYNHEVRQGVVFAEKREEILEKLDRYYGFDNIFWFKIFPLEDFAVYEFNEDSNNFKVEVTE